MGNRSTSVYLVLALAVAACTAAPPPAATSGIGTPAPATFAPTAVATAAATPAATPAPATPSAAPATPTAAPTPAASPTAVPVTRITSEDGELTVEVPDGAMPEGVEVTIERREAEDAPAELVDAGIAGPHYELLPSGTQFDQPVKVIQTWPRDRFGEQNRDRLYFLSMRSDDGTWEWLADAESTLTEDTVTVSGTTTHFSGVYPWSDRLDILVDPPAPRTDDVGETFSRTIEAKSLDTNVFEVNFTNVFFFNSAPAVILVGEDATGTPSAPKAIIRRDWTCLAAGGYSVEFQARLNSFAESNPFWEDTLGLAGTSGLARVVMDGTCTEPGAQPPVTVEDACINTYHVALGDFLSYLEFLIWVNGEVESMEVRMIGANDDQFATLTRNADGSWSGDLGLHEPGVKTITGVQVTTPDGQTYDVTDQATDIIGEVNVPFPDEPTFGECRDD